MSMFAKNVRYLRKQKGLSQDELAEKLGYRSYTTIQKWESAITEPTFTKAKKLSKLFGHSMNDMATIDLEIEDSKPKSTEQQIFTVDELGTDFFLEVLMNGSEAQKALLARLNDGSEVLTDEDWKYILRTVDLIIIEREHKKNEDKS